MDPQSRAHADSEYYDPYLQQPSQDGGWDPIAATPYIDSPASPGRRSRVAFAPVSPPAGADTPSSVGLGIGPGDPSAQFPGYQPVVSRDSFQQDSVPTTPALAHDVLKSPGQPQEYALTTPGAIPYYGQYPDAYGGGGGDRPPLARLTGPGAWRLLQSAWPMYLAFLFGFAFAVGHHIFYDWLDGRPADDQVRMMRFGGLLSYGAKALLLATVVFAYRQQVWVTAIGNVLELRTIDSLFAAVDEPRALLNWEFLKKARVAASLAVLAWLFPLTVILTPATLSVAPLNETRNDQCTAVRTLNFDAEKAKNWRNLDPINGYRGLSLSLWNCTVSDSSGLVDTPFNDTFFDYWDGSSTQVNLVATQSVLTGSVIPRPNVALETCSTGWNCSYTVSFTGPGYKCSELARGTVLDEADLMAQGVPLHVGELAPHGNYSYLASTTHGEYYSPQVKVNIGGAPIMAPPYPADLGAFRTEPVLWIAHSVPTGSGPPPANMSVPGWNTGFEAVLFRCDHYVTNYTVQFNHTYSAQTTTVLQRDYLHPVINTTFIPNKNAGDGTLDNTTALPKSNFVFPTDYQTYRLTAAYHSLGALFRQYLDGYMQYAPYATTGSQVINTKLLDPASYLPVPDLMAQVSQLYENMTLSLLSNPQFVVVSWASRPDIRSGVSNGSTAAPELSAYPCVRTRVANAYVYNRRDLWIAYAVATGAAAVALVLGSAALSQNDFRARNVHVSSVAAAMRAPVLDGLGWRGSRWGEVPREVLRARLGYGVVLAEEYGHNGVGGGGGAGWGRGVEGMSPPGMGMGTPGLASGSAPGFMGTWMGAVGSPVVVGGGRSVYYGFAPPEELERTRRAMLGEQAAGKRASRASAWSFRRWEAEWRGVV